MTFPYKHTAMDSLKDSLFVTSGIVGVSYILKMCKITPPIKFDAENILKLYLATSAGCFLTLQ